MSERSGFGNTIEKANNAIMIGEIGLIAVGAVFGLPLVAAFGTEAFVGHATGAAVVDGMNHQEH